jgi:hypothetical protein
LIAYNRLIEDNWLGIVYARQHEFDKAEEFYRVVFQRLENAAFTWGERFHRGLPLHNLGVVALLKGSIETAVEYFVSAYIEDCLTAGHEARGWMAAQALTKLGVSASLLNKAEQWVHTAASRPIVTTDQVNQISAELRQEACRSRLNVPTQDYAFALFSPETNQDLATALGRELSQVRNQLRVQKRFTWAIFLFALAALFLAIGALVR